MSKIETFLLGVTRFIRKLPTEN